MRSSNIPGSYIFLLFFSQFGLYAILVRFSSIIAQLLKNIRTAFVLNYNTHHSAPAVVDNFLHGILELCLAVLGDLGDFAADAVVNELLDGFAENVGIPDSLRALCALFDIGDQILRLLLTSDDRRNLRLDVGLDHMNRRANRFNFNDGVVLIIVLGLSVACIVLNSLDKAEFIFDPEIKILSFSPIFLILYTLYMFLPVIISISEGIKWHFLKQKI